MSDKKIPIEEIKKIPQALLKRLINRAKHHLKNDEVMIRIFKEYNEPVDIIDLIPTAFADLDVSAKTDHGAVYLNYELLCDGDFFKDYQYLIHEYTHWAQQCLGERPTKSADDGEYLLNPFEQEGFRNQMEYVSKEEGEDTAEEYVDDLIVHHEVKNPKKKKDIKQELLKLV